MTDDFDPRLTPARGDLAASYLEGLIEASRFADGEDCVVTVDRVSLRSLPDAGWVIDTEVLHGEVFTVYDRTDGWAWGQCAFDDYVGYLPDSALGPAPVEAPTHVLSLKRSFVYPGPDLKYPPVATLFMGAPLRVAETIGPWHMLAGGGCVWAGHCVPFGARWSLDAVTTAESFLGTPYLWGGRSADGIDCSGLVQAAMSSIGVTCPRDSDMQCGLGRTLSVGEALARGDLICYQGHVALSRGDGTVIHATGHVMAVMIEPQVDVDARVRAEQGLSPDQPAVITIRRPLLRALP